jgi:branched-chain amino acid transport system ATP-binding protein
MSAETGAMPAALEVSDLRAGYGSIEVVHGIDLRVEPGQVVALLGPNGAGKTTTLLTISGLLRPLGGAIALLGRSTQGRAAHEVSRSGVAHVPEDRALFSQLTVAENIRLGCSRATRRAGLEQVYEYFPELSRLNDRAAGLLSGGEQQMLAVGRALAAQPRLLLVDEMSLGLAPVIVRRLLPILRRVAQESGAAVLFVEQHVHFALEFADHAYVLNRGNMVMEGAGEELRTRRDLIQTSYLGGQSLDA